MSSHNQPSDQAPQVPPLRPAIRAHSSAPTRTADAGGWSDTWFAMHGTVCNVAIDHRAHVTVTARPDPAPSVRLLVRLTGEDYTFEPSAPPGRHAIIEHAIVSTEIRGEVVVDIAHTTLTGSGLGASASVMVALVAALNAVVGDPLDAGEAAVLAHAYETSTGKQSGVQDHAAAAWGGISRFDVRYPSVRHRPIVMPGPARADLSARLHTVFFGAPHESGHLHDQVIARLDEGASRDEIDVLRAAGAAAADALAAGDVGAYGRALTTCHDAIALLHPDLIGGDARHLEAIARRHGARGWKVNGAGGEGGSMVVLGPAGAGHDAALLAEIARVPGWQLVDAAIGAPGVTTELLIDDGGVA
jgi:D-glycero-alpha-D-manno-heptose-7-phosphate kinase